MTIQVTVTGKVGEHDGKLVLDHNMEASTIRVTITGGRAATTITVDRDEFAALVRSAGISTGTFKVIRP